MVPKISESQVQFAVADFLRRQNHIVLSEAQFFSKKIDLFAVHRPSLCTIAIEAKLHDWKRALAQANIYLLCADYVYIAVPLNIANIIAAKRKYNDLIGIVAVDVAGSIIPSNWAVSIFTPASQSVMKNTKYSDRLCGMALFSRFDDAEAELCCLK